MGTSDDRSGAGPSPEASVRALSEFLTMNRAEILARWRGAVRRTQGDEAAAELSDPVPELLDRVAELGPGGDLPVSATQVLEQARGRVIGGGVGFPAAVVAAGGPVTRRWTGDPLGAESGAVARTVYGFPLPGDPPAGAAYVTSVTTRDLPADDRRLFRAAVVR